MTSTLTLVSVLRCVKVILQCQVQGTAVAGAALPKRNILIVESYVTIAFVEDVVSFKRNRETILAESLVKLSIEARGRTELHVLLVSTAVPFHVNVHPDVARQMDGILELYDSQWIAEGPVLAKIFPGKPLLDDTSIDLWLPNSNMELCAEECLQLLYLGRILQGEILHLSIFSVRF